MCTDLITLINDLIMQPVLNIMTMKGLSLNPYSAELFLMNHGD